MSTKSLFSHGTSVNISCLPSLPIHIIDCATLSEPTYSILVLVTRYTEAITMGHVLISLGYSLGTLSE